LQRIYFFWQGRNRATDMKSEGRGTCLFPKKILCDNSPQCELILTSHWKLASAVVDSELQTRQEVQRSPPTRGSQKLMMPKVSGSQSQGLHVWGLCPWSLKGRITMYTTSFESEFISSDRHQKAITSINWLP
jgi:hypothetical protein